MEANWNNPKKIRAFQGQNSGLGFHWCPQGCGKKVKYLKISYQKQAQLGIKGYQCTKCKTSYTRIELNEIQSMQTKKKFPIALIKEETNG